VVPLEGPSLRERRKLLWNGAAAATLVIDRKGKAVAAPRVSLRGIDDEDGRLTKAIVAGLSEMLADLSGAERGDDGRIEEAARQAVRRVVRAHLGKKPLTDVHIVRI
jgi:ribonuclease J